jgi:hypothetical protein
LLLAPADLSCAMLQRRRPSGFVEPCLPSRVTRPPSSALWVHEIKHDGYRLMVRASAASRATAMTGAVRFPAIVEAASRIQALSFLIDGEACASGCISMRTSLEEGIKLHRFAGMFPEQFLTEAGRHREAVVAADQRMVIRCFRDDLAGFVHDVSHVPPLIQRAALLTLNSGDIVISPIRSRAARKSVRDRSTTPMRYASPPDLIAPAALRAL